MIIPHKNLNSETLRSLIIEFVSREGTDYGDFEVSLEQKINSVLMQLEKRDAVIVFDQESGSCNIVPERQLKG